MGYQIFTGHRLETLVEEHLDLFQTGFFDSRPAIVLQNQSLSQWLKLFLAKILGGYATGDFLYQDEALRRLMAPWIPEDDRVLFLDDLKLELYRYLAAALGPGFDPVFAPLAGGSPSPDPLRLFELADHVAGVFHNYAMNSSLWPQALAQGTLPEGSNADPAAFAWQSRLWRDLLVGKRGTLAGLVLERLGASPPLSSSGPQRLILVGSAFLSTRAAKFLGAWAQAGLVDVVQLLLLPAPPPWPVRRPWSSWGAFGRAFLEALPMLPPSWTPSPQGNSALSALQQALSEGQDLPPTVPDASLQIVSCPHPLRELEILRDRLLALLAADPTLEMNEIAVLAPDINLYAPFLDTAFGSEEPGRNLKFHVIDLDLGRENAWFRALDALLSLVSGTMDRPTLFSLIDTKAFQEAWDIGDERELWLDYTDEVSAWREETEPRQPQTWSASWDRLFSGWFKPSSADGELALNTAPSVFRDLGRFHKFIETLRERTEQTRRRRSFLEWIRFLDETVGTFLSPGDGTGAVLSGRLRTLVADAGSPEDPLPWAGFRAFVQDQIAHFPGRRGQLLTEGLHCSSLRPLRSIPFRVIAVLGLDEGRFPRMTPQPSFDLRRYEPGQDAVSSLALDRYTFWETLMAARSVLYLSYQGQSAVDGSERPPSPVLADLLDFLETDRPWPVVQASVKDFSIVAGSGPTWSTRTRRRAEALGGGWAAPVPQPVSSTAEDPLDLFPEVRSSEVSLAFTAPARFYLKRVRQIVLKKEDRRSIDDEEPWSMSFLERQGWLQEGLGRYWRGERNPWNVEALVEELEATGRVLAGVFTERDRRELARKAAQTAAWADGLTSEGWVLSERKAGSRSLWAGRPLALEPDERLVRGSEVLLPRLLYTSKIPARSLFDAALKVLQEPTPNAYLATLTPSGDPGLKVWSAHAGQTEALAQLAQEYWVEASSRPLRFYPDFLEALAARRRNQEGEPWPQSLEASWRTAKDNQFSQSENNVARDPYAALAFAQDPDWRQLADEIAPWWSGLFLPLLEVWK